MRPWETPVPIPNTTVKTWAADGTLLETARESRWMPPLKKIKQRFGCLSIKDKEPDDCLMWSDEDDRPRTCTLKTAY